MSEGALSLLYTEVETLRKLYLAGVAQEEIKLILTRDEYRQAYFHQALETYFRRVIRRSHQVDWAEAYFLALKKMLHCPGGAYLELALEVGATEWSLELAGLHNLPRERLEKMFDLTKVDVGEELTVAVGNNSPNLVEFLLAFADATHPRPIDADAPHHRPIDDEKFETALKLAAYDGRLEILKLFVAGRRFNSDQATKALNVSRLKIKLKNRLEVVTFLLTYPGILVSYRTFERYCMNGDFEIVKLLLPHFSPSRYESLVLRQACNGNLANPEGRAQVVKLLLEDGRADPAAKDSLCIQETMNPCNLEILKLLLVDGRADPSCEDNCLLRWACQEGHIEIVSLSLKDPRVFPTRKMYQEVLWHKSPQQGEIVRLLLQDERFDPTQFSLKYLQYDCLAWVEIMLDYYARLHADTVTDAEGTALDVTDAEGTTLDVSHNPSRNKNELLRWSLKQGDVAAVKLLLEVPVICAALSLRQQMECYRLLGK